MDEEIFLFCNSLNKENIEEKINSFMTKVDCTHSQKEVNAMLIRIVEELAEGKKYELIERVIGTKEKLKELMTFIPFKEEYSYHFYLASLSINGKFEELITIFEEVKPRRALKLYLEKIRFNVGKAYSKIGKYWKGIELLKENRSVTSKLFLAYIYTMLEDDKALEICRELQKSNLYLTCEEEAKIYLTYAKYSLKKGNIDETRENIDKLLFFLSGVKTGLKNVLFYEVAQIYKVIGTKEEYIYCLKQAAQFSAEGEVQMCHKLKAILELQNLKVVKDAEVIQLLPHEKYLLESDLVIELIKDIKGDIT